MKKILLLYSILIFSCTKKHIVYNVVEEQMPTTNPLYTITQTEDSTLFVAGGNYFTSYNLFYKSVNNNWVPIILNFEGTALLCLYANKNIVHCGGYAGRYASGDSKGKNWYTWNTQNFELINGMYANDNKLLIANGGKLSGVEIFDKNKAPLNRVDLANRITNLTMYNQALGYATAATAIYKTKDSGVTWQYTNAKDDAFMDIACMDSNKFIACGLAGGVYYSSNGGNTIKTLLARTESNRFRKIALNQPKTKAIIVGDYGLVYEYDVINNTLTKCKSFTTEHLLSVCSTYKGFAICGAKGKVWHLTP